MSIKFEVHVRDDDLGFVHLVDRIDVEKTLDWNDGPRQWGKEFNGIHYGQRLAGMEMECIIAPNNPSQWVRGSFSQNGKLTGSPTVPFEMVSGINGGHVFLYSSTNRNRELVALSRGGCGDWGDSPFSLIFDQPRTAFALTVGFNAAERGGPCTGGERWHVEMWGIDGTKVGHQDIVSIDPVEAGRCVLTISFVSDVPIMAVSTWVQNGPGVAWHRVDLGSATEIPPLTLEERVEILEAFHKDNIQEGR